MNKHTKTESNSQIEQTRLTRGNKPKQMGKIGRRMRDTATRDKINKLQECYIQHREYYQYLITFYGVYSTKILNCYSQYFR